MLIIYLLQLIFILLLISTSRKLYEYGNFEEDDFDPQDKIKFPIIAYIALILINFIPILGLIADGALTFWIIYELLEEEVYYKPGKIVKFLFKSI